MPQLNQIVAVENGEKTRAFGRFAAIDKTLQKKNLLTGMSRTYQASDEDGETRPAESFKVQQTVEDALDDAAGVLANLFDITATKEWANTRARADVVVDDETILADVPVTFLLFLERQLTDIRTFVGRLPTLDAGVEWTYDETQGVYRSQPVETRATKKVPRHYEKWVPPDPSYKQPAQVEMYQEDVTVGYWTKIDYSGALPADRVRELVERVDKLIKAVKFAREKANSSEVDAIHVGDRVFEYLFSE